MCSWNLRRVGRYKALEDIIDIADERLSRWDCIAVQDVPTPGTSTGAEGAMPAAVDGRPLVGRPEGASSLLILNKGLDSYIRMDEGDTHGCLCFLDMGDYSMIVGSLRLPTTWADHHRFACSLDEVMAALGRLRRASPSAEVCLCVDFNFDLTGERDPERYEILEAHIGPARLALRGPGGPT